MQNLKAEVNQEKNNDTFFLFCLVGSWLAVGLVSTLLGFFNLLYVPLFGLLAFPIYFLVFELKIIIKESWQKNTWLLLVFIIFILVIHATGIFTPETGFDAIWYHLPVLEYFKEAKAISYKPGLYQTANPLLSDMLFYPAFQILGAFGAKCTAYLLGLSLVVLSYRLSRQVLSVSWSLWFVVTILLIQPVAWQMSSFYVDIAKSFWEVSMLVWFLKKRRSKYSMYMAGILLGASLATKSFSILLLAAIPVLFYFLEKKERLSQLFLFVIGLLTIISPFYLYIWFSTGSPATSIGIHLFKLQEIGGDRSLISYLFKKIITFPFSWWYLFTAKDYISALIPILFPILIAMSQKLSRSNRKFFITLCWFSFVQWLVWWFVPPASTRYALSGFIVLLLLLFWAVQELLHKKDVFKVSIMLTLMIVTAWHLLPRLVVLNRNIKYLFGSQTNREYIKQFYDGNVDYHLDSWYKKTNTG